ncbi:uncharacterized protein [Anoplolepis gracilipes]|uniref:uncharacterized protein n=1 Tax=Anoplolepis gracilipes TaxID=354296 RepID=UPI003B9F2336
MTSRREDMKQQTSLIDICCRNQTADKFILLPASHILKSQDCVDDSVAVADKIPIENVSTAILEIDRSEKQPDDVTLKILHCPTSKTILETSSCDDRSRNQPVIFIECAEKHCEEPLTSVIQCSSNTDVSCQKSKMTGSPSDCEFACPNKEIDISSEIEDSFSQMTSEISSCSEKSLKKFKKRICPASCCQPVRQSTIRKVCTDFLRAKSSASDVISPTFVGKNDQQNLDEQQLQRLASKRMLRAEVARVDSAKSDKASTCQKSTIAFKRDCLIPERISEDTSRLSSSQELLARYKKYIPTHQLKKYEICRSKRNGLQDECIPYFLQSVLEKEKQQLTLNNECKRNIDQLDETISLYSEKSRGKQISKPAAFSVKPQKSFTRKKKHLKKVKSIELRAGTLYTNCDCYRRNGLQHDCPRTLCGNERQPKSFCGTKQEWLAEVSRRRLKEQAFRKAQKQ